MEAQLTVKEPLREATEMLNALIENVEARFEAFALGVRASVPMDDGYRLGYGKVGQRAWGLFIEQDTGKGDVHINPISGANRERRVLAVGLFEALRLELEATARGEAENILKVIAAGELWLEGLPHTSAKPTTPVAYAAKALVASARIWVNEELALVMPGSYLTYVDILRLGHATEGLLPKVEWQAFGGRSGWLAPGQSLTVEKGMKFTIEGM